MRNSEHQAAYRARQRAKGRHTMTVWILDSNYACLAQLCQRHGLPRELVVNHAMTYALLSSKRIPDSYWYNLRRRMEAERPDAGKNGGAPAMHDGQNGSGTIFRSTSVAKISG